MSSQPGLPLGLCCPSSFSIHTRSTGGATSRLARSRSCRSRRCSSRLAAYGGAVPLSTPGARALTGLTIGFPQDLTVLAVQHVVHTIAGERWPVRHCSGVAWLRLVIPEALPSVLPENVLPGFAFPPGGPWDSGAPPSRPGAAGSRPAVPWSAQTATSLSRSRAGLPVLPRYLGALVLLCVPCSCTVRLRGASLLARRESLPHWPALRSLVPTRTPWALPRSRVTPLHRMPRSQTPVVSWTLALAHPGLRPAGHGTPSACPSLWLEAYPVDHHSPSFGAPSRGLQPRSIPLRTPIAGGARGCALLTCWRGLDQVGCAPQRCAPTGSQ